MRINSRIHVLVFFIAVIFFSLSSFGFAQRNNRTAERDILAARTAAQRDARADTINFWWATKSFVLGTAGSCVLGSLGVFTAYRFQPAPPPERFIGKSPEYITAYTKTYKIKVRRLQVRWATVGCIGGTVVNGILWRIYYF